MSLREEMWKYEQITGESAEHVPIIKLGAFLDGYEMGIKASEQTDVLDKLLAIIAQKREFINNIKESSYVCDGYSLCLQMIEGQIIKLREEPNDLANNHYMQRFMRVD